MSSDIFTSWAQSRWAFDNRLRCKLRCGLINCNLVLPKLYPSSENSWVQKLWKRHTRRYIKPWLYRFGRWKCVIYNGVRVHFKAHLDGGGTSFGQDFIPLFALRQMRPQQRV